MGRACHRHQKPSAPFTISMNFLLRRSLEWDAQPPGLQDDDDIVCSRPVDFKASTGFEQRGHFPNGTCSEFDSASSIRSGTAHLRFLCS